MNKTLIEQWKNIDTNDELLKKDLELPFDKITNSFNSVVKFGTSGVSAKMGAGTNKINQLTIAGVAYSFAKWLKENNGKKGVVIGHDNRHNSVMFAEVISSVFAAQGIKAYLFSNNDSKPAPLVSFAIRKMKLDGGLMVTSLNGSKEYNGVRLYGNDGSQLIEEVTDKLQNTLDKLDLLKIDKVEGANHFLDDSVECEYTNELKNIRIFNETPLNIKVAFTAQHGTSATIAPLVLKELGTDVKVVEKQSLPNPDFKNTKSTNPKDGKTFVAAERLARKNKSDLIATINPDSDRFRIALRYKRSYKFLNGNQAAALYLNYLLETMKRKLSIPKDGFIATTLASSTLVQKIAAKYGVKTVKSHVGFKNVAEKIKNTKGTCIFAFEESYGFLVNPQMTMERDGIQGLVAMADLVSYYKNQGVNPYSKLEEIYEEFGIHRTTELSKNLKPKQKKILFKALLKAKKIGSHKVSSIEDYKSGHDNFDKEEVIKINFKDGSWISYRASKNEEKVKIYVENVGKPGEDLLSMISFEKEVDEFINDNSEIFEDKHWSWKTFWKYVSFLSIVIGILIFVFMMVYSTSTSATNGSKNVPIFSVAQAVINSANRWLWLSVWGWWFFTKFLGGWMKKRMFSRLNEKVKIRHIIISQMMGGIIGFVTPFAIGGDAIGYWYLRRKGVKRAPLIATLSASTIWGEVKFALQTLFLVAIGWELYKDIFANGDIQSHAALIWFFVGLAWSYFAAFMLCLLTMSRRIQEFIVRNSMKILEWFPYTPIYDPAGKAAGVQYEFSLIRGGMRRLFNKWWFILEMMVYDLLPLFLNPYALVLAYGSGVINPQTPGGPYWSYIVAGDIIGTANSMSLTPGGSGTSEWLNNVVREHIYGGNGSLAHAYSPKTIASGVNFMGKIFYDWPDLAISSLMIMVATFTVRKKPLKWLATKKQKYLFSSSVFALAFTAIVLTIFLI